MNGSIIRKILGYVLLLEGALLLLPCLVALYYGEKQGITYLFCRCNSAFGITRRAEKSEEQRVLSQGGMRCNCA